jgi:hypothetical protein
MAFLETVGKNMSLLQITLLFDLVTPQVMTRIHQQGTLTGAERCATMEKPVAEIL